MIASEAAPFSKTGGLADVASALPRALGRLGHEVTLFTPALRRGVGRTVAARRVGGAGRRVALGRAVRRADRRRRARHAGGVPAALSSGRALQRRRRRLRRQRPALRLPGHRRARVGGHSAPRRSTSCTRTTGRPGSRRRTCASTSPATRRSPRVPSVFTIHNLAYQGVVDKAWLPRLGLGWDLFTVDGLEFWDRLSLSEGRHQLQRCGDDGQPDLRAGNPASRIRRSASTA